nr:hypothetical protein [Tanacetum cinerariifolium]
SIGIDIPVRVIIYHRYRTYIMLRVGCCGLEHPQWRATPPPHPAYRTTTRISILAPVPMPAWTDSEGAPVSTDTELGGYVREFETRVRQDTDEIYMRLDDEQTERQLLAGRLNMLFRDRRAHAYTSHLMETEAMMSREAWKQMAPRRTTRLTVDQETVNVTTVTNAQLQAMIDQGVTAALATRDALRSTNGDDSHNPRKRCTEGVASLSQWCERMESVFYISNYAAENQVKIATCTLHSVALTWWNTHVHTIGHEAAYGMT